MSEKGHPSESAEVSGRAGPSLLFLLSFEAGILLVAWVLGLILGVAPLGSVRWEMTVPLAVAVGLVPTVLLLRWSLLTRWKPFAELREIMLREIAPLFHRRSTAELLLLSVLAGVAEEALFRGVAQQGLAGVVGVWPALALASLLFGLAHPISRLYVLLAGGVGAYFGLWFLFTGNLLVPILLHAGHDAIAFVALRRMLAAGESRRRSH